MLEAVLGQLKRNAQNLIHIVSLMSKSSEIASTQQNQ